MDHNIPHEDDEWEEVQGRKRNKVEQREEDLSFALDFRQIIYERFSAEQVKDLIEHLKELEKYYEFVSFQIEHQDRSISTLPKHILDMFGEIKERATRMVSRAKFNVDFLDSVLMPYKQLVMEAIVAEREENGEGSHSSHEHGCHHSHNAITNMFFHMVKEWSEQPEISYVHKVIDLLGRHWKRGKSVEGDIQKDKVLVVGSGMGRMLHQLKKAYGKGITIQGHQSDTQKYLCGQYFLNRCHQSLPIYPYLHNFCNFMSNEDAYRCISMPATIDDHAYYYPLTLGNFQSLYLTHEASWNVIITTFYNESVDDVLKHVRLIYRMLKEGGLWIDVSTSNLERNVIRLTYREYQAILDNSRFELLEKGKEQSFWYGDKYCLMNEKQAKYYRLMVK